MSPALGCRFYTLTDDVDVVYEVSKQVGDSREIGILWNNPDINIQWPDMEPIISKKEQQNLLVRDIDLSIYTNLV